MLAEDQIMFDRDTDYWSVTLEDGLYDVIEARAEPIGEGTLSVKRRGH